MTKKVEKIIKWMQEEVTKANAKGVIVPVSGGVDSAVTCHLAKLAFQDNSLAIWIDVHSAVYFKRNALRIFEDTKINNKIMDLNHIYTDLLLSLNIQNESPEINGNIKTRLRMTVIYAYANVFNYLVLGSTNKSEYYLGYFTKWGDGAADLYPLINLYKSEVYQLASDLNVNQRIIEAIPSADLWANQTDEKDLGFSYPELEDFLKGKEISKKSADKIKMIHEKNLHKTIIKLNAYKGK